MILLRRLLHQRRYVGKPPSDRGIIPPPFNSDDKEPHDFKPRPRTHRSNCGEYRRNSFSTGAAHGLLDLELNDPRLTQVLSYIRYRLAKNDGHFGPEVSRNIGLWTRQIEYVMGKHTFNGANPVACLQFLSIFGKQIDNEGVPEAGALQIWPSFLSG